MGIAIENLYMKYIFIYIQYTLKQSWFFCCQVMKKFWHSGQQESRSEEGMESAKYTTKYTTAIQSGSLACYQNAEFTLRP